MVERHHTFNFVSKQVFPRYCMVERHHTLNFVSTQVLFN